MEHDQQKILVYGATGVQGGTVARQLLQTRCHVRVLVRDPHKGESLKQAGAELAVGNLLEPASLKAASQGIDAVFLHLPLAYDPVVGTAYGKNAIDTAKEAGVGLLVFSTSGPVPASKTGVAALDLKRDMETYLQQSGIPSIILRPTFYMENFAAPWSAPAITQQGIVAYPLPSDFKASWVSVEDASALAVKALSRPVLAGSVFNIGGPETLNGDEIAERFSTVLSRQVRYYAIPLEQFEQQLNASMGEPVGTEVSKQYCWFVEQPVNPVVVSDMQSVVQKLPVHLTTLEQWISRTESPAFAEAK